MQLHALSPSTQNAYVRSIANLAKYYHKSPDLISEDELRLYFLDRTQEKKVSHSTDARSSFSSKRPSSGLGRPSS